MATTRLTDAQVTRIRALAAAGSTQRQVAALFKVSEMTISNVVRGRTYRGTGGEGRASRKTDNGIRHGVAETPERRRQREGRFWANVDRSGGPNACWPWTAGLLNTGYGNSGLGHSLVGSNCAHVAAHTLASRLDHAPAYAGDGTVLRHLCNNKVCCNPAHLKPGTRSENQHDRVAAATMGPPPHPVETPVAAPAQGWYVVDDDPELLKWQARVSEYRRNIDMSAGPDGCWPWVAKTRHAFGYGQMRWYAQQTVPAHRIAIMIERGFRAEPLASTDVVRHRCPGQPNCNNPAHLVVGTQAENIRDKITDGTMPRGDTHHKVTISDAQVVAMRESYWGQPSGKRPTLTLLAARHETTITTISRIINGRSRAEAGGPTCEGTTGAR